MDGFWNTDESFTFPRQKYSQDAIGEFQVVGLGGTAEFGRAIGGIVNAVTKSGTNGSADPGTDISATRSSTRRIRCRSSATCRKPNSTASSTAARSAARCVQDRTFFFGAAERTQQNQPQDNNITAATGTALGLPAEDVGAITGTLRDTFAMGKLNHNLTSNHSLSGRVYVSRRTQTSPRSASFATAVKRSAAGLDRLVVPGRVDSIAQRGQLAARAAGVVLPARLHARQPRCRRTSAHRRRRAPRSNAPTVNITEHRQLRRRGRLPLADADQAVQIGLLVDDFAANAHAIKFGVDVMFVDFVYIRYTGPQTGIV